MSFKLILVTLFLACTPLWAEPAKSRNTFMVFGNTYVTKLETKDSILASINQAVKDAKIEFVIMVGELTMDATVEQFQVIQFVIKNSPVPVHVTASNHDLAHDNGDWKTGKPDDYARFRKMLKTETEYTLSKGRSHFIMQSHTDKIGTDFTKKALAKLEGKKNYDFVYHVKEASLGAEIDRKNKPIIGINGGTKEVKHHVIAGRHAKVVPIENKTTDKEDDYLIFKENEGYIVVDSYIDRRLDRSFKILINRPAGTCSIEKQPQERTFTSRLADSKYSKSSKPLACRKTETHSQLQHEQTPHLHPIWHSSFYPLPGPGRRHPSRKTQRHPPPHR